MLGRLLHTAANTLNPSLYGRNPPALESATEEEHTRSLLFPNPSLLHNTGTQFYPLHAGPTSPITASSGSDDRSGLELDAGRDLRVIIAQDALGDQDDPCVLLDSKDCARPAISPTPSSPTQGRHRRGPSVHSPVSPALDRTGPFSPSIPPNGFFQNSRARSQTLPIQQDEDIHSPGAGDTKDETRTLLSCMFGSSALSYKGASTKMHIISTETTGGPATASVSANFPDTSTLNRRRREPLHRAHTYGTLGTITHASHVRSGSCDSFQGKDAILLTRMFSVLLPETMDSAVEEPSDLSIPCQPEPSYPFPKMNGHIVDKFPKRRKLKEKKTPTYAVGIVVQLPLPTRWTARPDSRTESQHPSKLSEPVATSFDSDFQNSWTFLESPSYMPRPNKNESERLDHHIEMIVENWDIVARSLSSLEAQASKEILRLLKDIDSAHQHALPPKPPKEKSMQRTNQRIIQLLPLALASNERLKDLAHQTIKRIVRAIRIPRVICGQNRWGPFLDEARWVMRWVGGKEHNFFFFNILTAFLGNHTEWLAFLGPEWYKRRYLMQQRATQNAEPVVASRTVLISPDKMAARRLLFLLASFLPPSSRPESISSPMRPGTSISARQTSHSPPTGGGSFSRQQSLRRTINKRATENRLTAGSLEQPKLSTSASSNEEADILEISHRRRQGSDTHSIRTVGLPIPENDLSSRKSSAATTSTVTPNPATPVPHFASAGPRQQDYFPSKANGNVQDSYASANLRDNLRRSTSAIENDSHGGSSKWGSLLSGVTFWSGRSESSSAHRTSAARSPDRDSIHSSTGRKQGRQAQSRLSQMVEEIGGSRGEEASHPPRPVPISTKEARSDAKFSNGSIAGISDTSKPDAPPMKLMVDEQDGIVDVDIGFPGFLSCSADSHVHSVPAHVRHMPSFNSLDGLTSIYSNASTANLSTQGGERSCTNVAGWLNSYHEDFVLQAVRPYAELEYEIKASMSREPTPQFALPASTPGELNTPIEQWVDVCSTLMADTRSWSIKRISLKRRIRTRDMQVNGFYPEVSMSATAASAANANSALPKLTCETLEETFSTEPLMDLDATLIDAIERITAQGGRQSSQTASPSRSHHRSASNASTTSTSSTKDTLPPTLVYPPAECKKIIVGALEDVVRSVSEDLTKHESGRDIESRDPKGTLSSVSDLLSSKKTEDNALREGIRKWLLSVENMEGA
ncbi:MAG: hypothetical protein Q9227_005860 [Pyrenula ochraceoflavens]